MYICVHTYPSQTPKQAPHRTHLGPGVQKFPLLLGSKGADIFALEIFAHKNCIYLYAIKE